MRGETSEASLSESESARASVPLDQMIDDAFIASGNTTLSFKQHRVDMRVYLFGVAPSEQSGPVGQPLPPFVRHTESGRRVHRLVTTLPVTLVNASDLWPGRRPRRAIDRLPPPSNGLTRLHALVASASEDNQIGVVLTSHGYWQRVITRATKEGWAHPPAAGPLTGTIAFKREGKVVGEAIILPHPRGWPLPKVRGRRTYRRALLKWLPRAQSGAGATPWQSACVSRALARLGL